MKREGPLTVDTPEVVTRIVDTLAGADGQSLEPVFPGQKR
jgi:hypothetical protein